MKIGILTYHYALNYGAVLQGLAMQTFLRGLGHQVVFINYRNSEIENSYKLFKFREYSKRRLGEFFKTFFRDVLTAIKYYKFKRETSKLLSIEKTKQTEQNYCFSNYDRIIIGSDQVWNEAITGGSDYFYNGNFNRKKLIPLIGYAISINKIVLNDDFINKIRSIVKNFLYISIREKESAKVLNDITHNNIYNCLDPVFLISKKEWENMIPFNKNNNYILAYAILNQEKVLDIAKRVSLKYGLELVILNPMANYVHDIRKCISPAPLEFVSFIKNAKLVFTSSFHGTAFSTILEKDFYVIGDDISNIRMKSFLQEINLSNRIIDNFSDVDLHDSINYSEVNEILQIKKNKSTNFLIKSIK